jgi:hypothetical protein
MPCQLLFLNGARAGTPVRFDQPAFWVGRDPHCELALDANADRAASARHAEIKLVGGSYKLEDHSSNGTFVNGQRVKEAVLKEGDVLELGQGGPQLRFTVISESVPATIFQPPAGGMPKTVAASSAPSPAPAARPAAAALPAKAPASAPSSGGGALSLILRIVGSLFLAAAVACVVVALLGVGGGGKAEGGGGNELALKMYTKEKLITGAYKVYGLRDGEVVLWLAKTVFRNETDGVIKDLRVRYRLGEYADWCSWQVYPALVPTQTVVDLFHPILSSSIAKLSSRTPADLQMEAEWTDARGEKKKVEKAERISLLSSQEFFFSDLKSEERTGSFQDFAGNANLLASYVTPQDIAVSGLASMANERAKGAGASTSDNACIAVMAELYEILRTIHVTYQSPSHQVEKDKSFDTTLVQTLQYPRDTIRKRTGTCIDLALLYASMMNAVGIKPVLVMLDGHAFPAGITPGGSIVPVETTGVGGGGRNSIGFVQAVQVGQKELKQLQETGRFIMVNLQKAWGAGITPPELPALPPDILDRWKITAEVRGGGQPVPAPADQPAPAPAPEPAPAPAPGPAASLAPGDYSVATRATSGNVNGTARVAVAGAQVQILFSASAQGRGNDGRMHRASQQNLFVGTISGNTLRATCNKASLVVDGQQSPVRGLPIRLQLTIGADGRSASGTAVDAAGERTQVTMRKAGGGGAGRGGWK